MLFTKQKEKISKSDQVKILMNLNKIKNVDNLRLNDANKNAKV